MKYIFLISLSLMLSHSLLAQDLSSSLVQGRTLERDSLIMDLNLLEQALSEMHPGLYRYNTEDEITQQFDQLRAKVYDGITEAKMMKYLAQTIVKIRCGHTYINPWNMDGNLRSRLFGGEIYIPLGFRWIDGKMIITHNASEASDIKAGAEILSINGVDIEMIKDSLWTVGRSDGHNFESIHDDLSVHDYRAYNWNAFDLYFPLFFPMTTSEFVVAYANYGEKDLQVVTLKALNKEAREQKMKERYGIEILENKEWELDILSPKLAVMKLGTFAIWNWKDFDSKAWFAESFQKLKEEGVENLVIDIRGNGGGLSEPRDEVLEYLIREKITCEDKGKVLIRGTKLNPELVPYINTWEKILIKGLPKIMYKEYNDMWYQLREKADCKDLKPQKNRFTGQIYMLGGPSNVSATFIMLERANQFGFATVVGEMSGGNQQGINGGSYAFFYMPYSRMEVDIPLKYFAPNSERPDAGIAPKIEISHTQESISRGIDPHLTYIQTLID